MTEADNSRDDIEKRVLDAASELFVHFGYDKTTMNDIASKAGVAKKATGRSGSVASLRASTNRKAGELAR